MSLQVGLPLNGNLNNQGTANLTINGNPSFSSSGGKLFPAYLNTGNNIYVTVPSITGKKVCTFAFGAYVVGSSITSNGTLVARFQDQGTRSGSHMRFEVCPASYANGIYCFSNHNNANYGLTSGVIESPAGGYYNQGVHFCFTSDGTTFTRYMNGEKIGTCAYDGPATLNGTFELTNNHLCYKQDFRVYDNCLSAAEVKALASGLVMHYPMNNGYIEPTTNVVEANKATFSGGGVGYTNGYTSMTLTDMGPGSLVITNKLSWCGAYTGFTIPEAGTYTLSVYCKPISRTSSDISQTLYFSAGEYSDNAVAASGIPGKWQRISMTRTFSASCGGTLYLIAYGGDGTGTISCEYTMPQIEKNDHPTPFCIGSRVGLTVSDTSGYKNSGIASVSPTCLAGSARYDKCYNFDGGNQSIQIPFYNSVINSGIFTVNFGFYKSDGGSKGYETLLGGPGGFELESKSSSTNQPYLVAYSGGGGTAAYTLNAGHMVTMVRTTSDTKFYLDGTLVINGSAGSIPSGDYFIGAGNTSAQQNYRGKMSDFRVYTTALTQADITDLYNAPIKIASNGSLITNGEVVE